MITKTDTTPTVGKPFWHRGFVVKPVFSYGNGIFDIEYYKLIDPEVAGRVVRGTIEKARTEINERITED